MYIQIYVKHIINMIPVVEYYNLMNDSTFINFPILLCKLSLYDNFAYLNFQDEYKLYLFCYKCCNKNIIAMKLFFSQVLMKKHL